MNDHFDLERRLHRLLPAEVPRELQGKLDAAEPASRAVRLLPRLPELFAAWFRPWPLAYAGLGAAWVAILLLHLLTPAPPPTNRYVPVAQASDSPADPAPATLTAGFSPDRAILLARNNHPDFLWP